MSDAPSQLKKLTPGRRLAAMLAVIAALEVAAATGLSEQWILEIWSPSYAFSAWRYLSCLQSMTARLSAPMFTVFFFLVAAVATIALAVRAARGATPGSARDPVRTVRDFFRRHPRFAAFVPWVPAAFLVRTVAVALQAEATWRDPWWIAPMNVGYPVALVMSGALVALLGRQLLRMVNELPDAERSAAEQPTTVDRAELSFQAIAVTGRTTGAVVAVAALAVAMTVAVATSNTLWIRDAAHGAPLAGYFAALIGTALWFRKASTIAVGRDGILVRGTSKERFYAYGSFDEVRRARVHLDLMRGAKRVVRLQLHGPDAERAEALAERIRSALGSSRRTDGAHLFARAADAESLGRAVQGANDYRQASVTREQLWELVEGEATDEQARMSAAKALATSSDRQERDRLRIAATQVADPKVRIALEELAEDEAHSSTTAAASPAMLRGAS